MMLSVLLEFSNDVNSESIKNSNPKITNEIDGKKSAQFATISRQIKQAKQRSTGK